jgi:hypothetical protein
VDAQAIACPHCRYTLKAHGHPGIPLYRSDGKEYLCQTCIYDADDTCNYPQRPYARECTLYTNVQPGELIKSVTISPNRAVVLWFRRNAIWCIVLGLIAISLLLALAG